MKALNQKHINEAQSAGLKLVSRAPNAPNSMIYECPDCNENVLIRVETVRKLAEQKGSKGYDCPICKESNYHDQAKVVGLTVIGSVQNTHNLLYRFDDCGHEQEISKQSVRNNEFKCQTCYQQQLEAEANKRHLTVIGKGSSGNYYLYENISCGHRYELISSQVRINGIKSDKPYPCRYCLYDQRMSEAKAAGLLLYGESHKSGAKNKSYLYQAPCGHSLERQVNQIRTGDWRCQACVDTKLNEECENVGLSLVGKGSDKAYRTYQFKDCGHVKEITTASVRNRTFHCDVCFWDDVDNVLTKRGLKIIDKGAKGDSRLFQFLDCGHVQDIELQKAKDGSFVCHECDDTFYTLPSNVYLLRIIAPDFEWLKLGYAKVVETRIRQYRLPLGVIAEPLAVLPTSTGQEALKIEKMLERKYKSQKLSATKMKKWHRNSGFTECYPISMRDALEHEIAKLQ